MKNYQKIVVALDIYATHEIVLERALHMAHSPEVLHLVNVTMPNVYFEPYGAAFENDFVTDLREKSKKRLLEIAKKHHISAQNVHAVLGSPADEIHNIAKEVKADLIVIGTHGQSGLRLLLGSTANGVLHGVTCDVLAVKI